MNEKSSDRSSDSRPIEPIATARSTGSNATTQPQNMSSFNAAQSWTDTNDLHLPSKNETSHEPVADNYPTKIEPIITSLGSPQGQSYMRNRRGSHHNSRSSQYHHRHHSHASSQRGGAEPVIKDSFGNEPYECQLVSVGRNAEGAAPSLVDVPWEIRTSGASLICPSFSILSTRYFWFLIEYALRVTLIGMLVPAAIINAELKHSPFISSTFVLTSVVIAVGTTTGQATQFCVQYIKAGFIWLPLATICVALKLNEYLAAWFVVYVALLFIMAMFTERTARRMCLLLYNICMVNLLSGDQDLVYPTRVFVDWGFGALFAVAASLVPYPMLATHTCRKISKQVFMHSATAFTGILNCFWVATNTERSMAMVKVRFLVKTLDVLIDEFDKADVFTFYEVLVFERFERREVRKEKMKLLFKLKLNLRAMERVINIVQDKPQILDQSNRCVLFRDHLAPQMEGISRTMETLLHSINQAKMYKDLKNLGPVFEQCGSAIKRIQDEFSVARRVLFYEDDAGLEGERMEEFVPLMTFFVFSIVNFWTTLEEFRTFIETHEPIHNWRDTLMVVWKAFVDPFVENAMLVRDLCTTRPEAQVRVVIEAAKVSVAMLVSVIFFYYVDDQSLLLSGPTIIAFVSGTNPVEALQASAARLAGTLFGCVLGFFAGSLSKTAVDRVLALCIITFVMTFFRTNLMIGTICMYCTFVAVSNLAPSEQTAEQTISRIQQNTFAILIYCFISVVFFPVSPNKVLLQKRITVFKNINKVVTKLMFLFDEVGTNYIPCDNHNRLSVDIHNLSGHALQHFSSFAPGANDNGGDIASDFEKIVREHSSNMGHKSFVPHAFTMAPQDKVMQLVFVDIFSLLDTMKATSSIMPLASDEFHIIPKEYPLRATGDLHAALYRMCALVYTMACSWKAMREKGYFTNDVVHIFHNLWPVTSDISACLEKFVNVLEFYVAHPESSASSELTRGVMQFRSLCVALSARKERCLLSTIRKTIDEQRINPKRHGRGRNNTHSSSYSPRSMPSNSVASPVVPAPVVTKNSFPSGNTLESKEGKANDDIVVPIDSDEEATPRTAVASPMKQECSNPPQPTLPTLRSPRTRRPSTGMSPPKRFTGRNGRTPTCSV
ncbi:Fusaric acid resistance protein-like, putative [Angomonas deanei]|uniref:Fusaric acid resistance protein-like, putative n=1 Tax=Angomonas deanei TaxID=59799 RepID=A0A7G2C6F6_9TRYP|nr:Fusaric acid resistance protein-like, putative [Angomonas deanei]